MRKPIHQFSHRRRFAEGGSLGKDLPYFIGLTLCLFCSLLSAQTCPSIVNCPQSTSTHCDESFNDSLLWNVDPFTFSPSIGSADLHEGPIDLNIRLKGCNGGGLGIITYILYLDLDNDGLQETVLTSGNPPPPGCVLANNSFNPGFSGGDTVRFDRRNLPDSMLYRFALEINYSGDTTMGWMRFNTLAAPYDFVPVILPEGRHRFEWRASQDGIERYCDRNFKIKDCKPPTISCKTGLEVYLDVSQTASITLAEALDHVFDNITPDNQLVLGMRRVGSGTGFPYNAMGDPQDTVMFSCDNADSQFVEIWAKDKADNFEHCTAQVLVYDTAGFCPFAPFPSICARNYANNEIIRDVSFSTQWESPNGHPASSPLFVHSTGCSELASLPPADTFSLLATKDTFPLNGVTTYDLVLISKHILNLEPFNEGWKVAAADVNRSNSVTIFDIVELRKLILGLTHKMPNGTPSWSFYVDSCMVWGHPFFGDCPKEYRLPLQALSWYPPHLSFKGIKMGDVNGTASNTDTLQGIAQTRGPLISLELPDRMIQSGETIQIPLLASEGLQWEGFQFSLNFDPDILEIEEVLPSPAISLKAENWAKPKAGVLNLSWSEALPGTVLPGDALLYLRLKAHSTARLSEVLNMPTDDRILPEAYAATGQHHGLQLVFSEKSEIHPTENTTVFDPMPNPTTGLAQLPLRLNVAETVSIEISDLSGKIIWRSVSNLESGVHLLEIPTTALPQSGVYVWRVCAGNLSKSGRLVRL